MPINEHFPGNYVYTFCDAVYSCSWAPALSPGFSFQRHFLSNVPSAITVRQYIMDILICDSSCVLHQPHNRAEGAFRSGRAKQTWVVEFVQCAYRSPNTQLSLWPLSRQGCTCTVRLAMTFTLVMIMQREVSLSCHSHWNRIISVEEESKGYQEL